MVAFFVNFRFANSTDRQERLRLGERLVFVQFTTATFWRAFGRNLEDKQDRLVEIVFADFLVVGKDHGQLVNEKLHLKSKDSKQ